MLSCSLILLAGLTLLCLPAVAQADRSADAATRAEIEAFYVSLARAQEARDVAAVMAVMGDDPVLTIGSDADEWYPDRATLERGYAAFFAQAEAISLSFSLRSVCRSGDVAWVAGKAPVRVTLKSGETQAFTGRFTAVLLHGTDGWRMVQSHFSGPADGRVETL